MDEHEIKKTFSEQLQLLAERSKISVSDDDLYRLTMAMVELVKIYVGL